MIIYGWGRQTSRTLGTVGAASCSHCGTLSDFHLVLRRTWFTLFFIPVVPYRSKFLVLCSLCLWGWQPTDSEVLQMKAAISNLSMPRSASEPRAIVSASPAAPSAVASPASTQLTVGDLVYPHWGSNLMSEAREGGEVVGAVDRTGPAVVLAIRGSWIQIRDSVGHTGWLDERSIGATPS